MGLDETIRRLALENAVKYNGKANEKALFGGVIKAHPEVKNDMQSTRLLIKDIVDEVNALDPQAQLRELLTIDPLYEEKQSEAKQQRKDKAGELPELPNAVSGKVVTRMSPEPSKYTHLGHAMSFLINYLYAKMYGGKVILRLEDTNPEKSTQEFVDAMKHDVIEYLGAVPDEEVIASDHMEQYYEFAQQLIDSGNAYVCACPQETIAAARKEMKPCEHRDQAKEKTQSFWEDMKAGKPEEGSLVLRLKIDMAHKNAVMRDPVIYRLSYTPHYRTGEKYKVWPMYDFENAIEEGLSGVTHVMRSNEFDSRIELQHYIAKLFDFPHVEYKHYGRTSVIDGVAQGRVIREMIESGEFIGWDDPRLITLKALARRGIIRESYYELVKKIGMSKTQTQLDFSIIAAVNRALLDKSAKRFFAIRQPVVIEVINIPDSLTVFNLAFHPHGEKGERKLAVTKNYYLEQEDLDKIEMGDMVRFMDAMNVKRVDADTFEFVSESYDDYAKIKDSTPIIHFVPQDGTECKAEIFLPSTKTQAIICEPSIQRLIDGDVIQFERYAFCRLDEVKEDGTRVFWFAHE